MNSWSTLKPSIRHRTLAGATLATTLVTAYLVATTHHPVDISAAEQARSGSIKLGQGTATTLAALQTDGAPRVIGLSISDDALATLPQESSDYHHCFDRNGDGQTNHATECNHSHEYVIPFAGEVEERGDIPFQWVLLNWNLHGHHPPGIYNVPHFDVHFMMEPVADIFAIKDGPCGPEFVDCDDFQEAKVPVPEHLMHQDFKDVDGVVAAMGNHLIDLTGQEFQGEPFSRSWIYGAYGGRVIFYEEMV